MLTSRVALIIGALLFCIPLPVSAEQAIVWDFRGGEVPGQWNVRGLETANMREGGLRIATENPAVLWRATDLTHPIDVVTFVVTATKDAQANLLWHVRGAEEGILVQLPFAMLRRDSPQTIDVAPGTLRQWDQRADVIGLELPAGGDLILHEIRLRHWSTAEKFIEAWKSFWMFDAFRPYSINFLWGPLLALTPPARAELFEYLPPRAHSAVWVFYALLLIAGISSLLAMLLARSAPRARRAALLTVMSTAIGLWFLFDLRMGAEILTYAATDLKTYVLPPPGQKIFRTLGNFHEVAREALPFLTSVPQYGLLVESESPYEQHLRYLTYPSIPVRPEPSVQGLKILLVLDRPDIRAEDDRIVTADGMILAQGGKLLIDFGDNSFLYGIARP